MTSYTWRNGNASRQWTDAKNWSPEGVPEDDDEVTVPAIDVHGNTGVNGPGGAPPISLKALTLEGLTLYDGPFTVTGQLTWTGGAADADIIVTGAASITGLDGTDANPCMVNQHTLTISGTAGIGGATIGTGPQQFGLVTGSRLLNTGTVSLFSAGFSSNAGFGTMTNNGSLKAAGTCLTTGVIQVTHSTGAHLSVASGGSFVVGTDTTLRLAGGTIGGDGTLQVGDGGGGEIDTVVDTTVPRLVIGGDGTVAPSLGGGVPSPDLPGVLTVQTSLGWGHGATDRQYSSLLGHLVLAEGATAVVENNASITDGKFENLGRVTLSSKGSLRMQGLRPVFVNAGRVTIGTSGTISGGSLSNTGLIEKIGPGSAVIDTALENRGNVAVNEGALRIGDEDWTIAGGTVHMRGGSIEGPGLGRLRLVGGTEGGVLAGAGSVTAGVLNGGWVEPREPGLTLAHYTQLPEGNIAFPPAAATAKAPLLSLGDARLDGSLWVLTT